MWAMNICCVATATSLSANRLGHFKYVLAIIFFVINEIFAIFRFLIKFFFGRFSLSFEFFFLFCATRATSMSVLAHAHRESIARDATEQDYSPWARRLHRLHDVREWLQSQRPPLTCTPIFFCCGKFYRKTALTKQITMDCRNRLITAARMRLRGQAAKKMNEKNARKNMAFCVSFLNR